MRRFVTVLILALLAIPAVCIAAAAATRVAVSVVPDRVRVAPGATMTVAIEQKIAPGWHTYWSNPGEAGMPTAVAWTLPKGWKAGAIQWPTPKREPVGPLMDYGYEGTVWLLVDVTVPATAKPDSKAVLSANVQWLACRDICVPEEATVSTDVFVETGAPAPDAIAAERFDAARAKLPVVSPWPAVYAPGKPMRLFLAAAALSGMAKPAEAQFFPARTGQIVDAAKQALQIVAGGIVLTLPTADGFSAKAPLEGVVVLTMPDGTSQALSVRATPGEVPASMPAIGPWLALALAFLGGLILNVMPCVLPILAMKVLAMTQQAHQGRKVAQTNALAYCGGVLISFVTMGLLLVALRAGGHAIGWGFQLQEPPVVAVLAYLLFAVGLNFLGLFSFSPVAGGDTLTRRPGPVGAFFTGVLAVAVAAPCTAPFMATAIGFALTQSTPVTIGVFVALGAGFALPFLLFAGFPNLNRFLPKPGPWMVRFQHWMALPMFCGALWLTWVLAMQVSKADLLLVYGTFAVLLAGLWAFGASRNAPWRRLGSVLAIAGIVACLAVARSIAPAGAKIGPSDHAQTYSQPRLAALRQQKRPVFVDVYASWCIACMVNEETTLSRPAIRKAFAEKNIILLKADWTRKDPEIAMLLEAHGRSGVPLYLYYPPGGGEAKILPQILTEDAVLKAVGD